MNAAIRAVARQAIAGEAEVLGIERGFEGLLEDAVRPLRIGDVGGILDRGGTFLGTARSERMFTEEGLETAVGVLRARGVTGLVVIGGNGSFRAADELHARGVKVCGVPATIDNDVGGTDTCVGFDTALNTIAEAAGKVRDTASSHARTFVIEVMGRRSGMLALYSGLACGADRILVPEVPFDIRDVCRTIVAGVERGKRHSLVVVAEGAAHAMHLAAELSPLCGHQVRAVVLGHVQRGGSPSAFDRILASRMSALAVRALLEGQSGVMAALRYTSVRTIRLSEGYTAERALPQELYDLAGVLAR
ncbi:MAG: 6-phosphofructokinase [Coriobacteriia bacterium]|nr:6-phosphofructokinase [Coriobacteriia bacterium]